MVFSLQVKSRAQVFKDFGSASISKDRSVFANIDFVTQVSVQGFDIFPTWYDMTVEMKGWGLDNKNCSLSMWCLIPFCNYKSVGCGSHKNTFLKELLLWIEEVGLSDGLSDSFISTAVAKDTEGFWQLRCRAYEITNFGRKRSFWPSRS